MNQLLSRGPRAARHRRSDDAVFRRARLQLTGFYVLTLAVLGLAFSAVLYTALASQLSEHQGRAERSPDPEVERETSDFALSRLRLLLAAGNVVLLAAAAGCGRSPRPSNASDVSPPTPRTSSVRL
jgi:hypothetical protein